MSEVITEHGYQEKEQGVEILSVEEYFKDKGYDIEGEVKK